MTVEILNSFKLKSLVCNNARLFLRILFTPKQFKMKSLTLSVTIRFSESIERDEDIQEVMENVKSALVHEVDTKGLSPESADWFTTKIEVSEPYTQTRTTHDFLTDNK